MLKNKTISDSNINKKGIDHSCYDQIKIWLGERNVGDLFIIEDSLGLVIQKKNIPEYILTKLFSDRSHIDYDYNETILLVRWQPPTGRPVFNQKWSLAMLYKSAENRMRRDWQRHPLDDPLAWQLVK